MKLRTFLILGLIAAHGFSAPSTTFAKTPKFLKKVEKSVNRSDAVQSAILNLLIDSENGFQSVLGDPISSDKQRQLIDDTVSFPAYNQAKSRMDRLRDAEAMADSAREVNVTIPDADGLYYLQNVVQPGSNTTTEMVQYSFDVVYSERVAFARALSGRLQGMFMKDKKWMKSGTEDPALNPYYGQMTFVYNVKVGMGGAEMVMVSVDYAQTEEIHQLSHGVMLKVYKMTTSF